MQRDKKDVQEILEKLIQGFIGVVHAHSISIELCIPNVLYSREKGKLDLLRISQKKREKGASLNFLSRTEGFVT